MSSQEALSQKQAGKRRRRSAPPPRLGWPGGMSQSQSQTQANTGISHSQPTAAAIGSSKTNPSSSSKRKRTLLSSLSNNNDTDDNNSNSMWTDKYAPTCRKDLCVAPKKIQEVAQWLENDANSQERLLILVGRPGIGKSTMIKVLAQEVNAELLEWSETYSTWSQHVDSQSPLNSFAQFLQQSGAGFSSLGFQLTTTTHKASSSINKESLTPPKKRWIVLEELPHLATTESQDQFRELFTNHVQSSNVKTVWIYSDVTEGNHKPQDLERHIDASVLYAHSKILQINPATKTQLKKSLERIAQAERFAPISKDFCERMHVQSGGDVRYAIMALQFDQAGGQRYHTHNAKKTSFFALKKGKNKNSLLQSQQQQPLQQAPRDTQWTAFHALGKILYAKREEVDDIDDASISKERPPLKFDPEGVLEHCDLDLGNALTYLGHHSVDFFTDIQEVSTAFDLYSDASYLLEQTTNYNYQRRYNNNGNTNTNTVSCPIFPEGYVTSLASRSVAYANHHPAPSRFRHLEAPKIFEIRRKRTDNEHQLHRLQQRLSMVSMADVARGTGSSDLAPFVLDRLPFWNVIAPQAVTKSLDRLHSSNSEHAVRFLDVQREEEAAAMDRLQKEQEAVLQLDDIEEFNSSDEENEPETTATTAAARNNVRSNPHQQPSSVVGRPVKPTPSQPAQPSQPVKRPTKPVFNPYKKKSVVNSKAAPQVSWARPSKELAKKYVNPYANPKK